MKLLKRLWKSSKKEVSGSELENNKVESNTETQIPKIIHQIWIGNSPMPNHCVEFTKQMKELNPDYEYHLWGNEIFDEIYKDDIFLKYYRTNPEVFKWAFIADRIRLLLLRDYGGIYVDVDAKPIQSFDVVLDKLEPYHTFFSGLKPSQNNNTLVDCTVYGSAPNSRIINLCLDTYTNVEWANGCRMFSDKIIAECDVDVALFNYKFFYDSKITDDTIVLHDVEDTRLISWAFTEDDKKRENW